MAHENTILVYQDAASKQWVATIGDTKTNALSGYGNSGDTALQRLLSLIKNQAWSFEDQKVQNFEESISDKFIVDGKEYVLVNHRE